MRLKTLIEGADENHTLNIQRRTNTKQIEATKKLSYLLIASWVPNCLSMLMQKVINITFTSHKWIIGIGQITSFLAYVGFPAIYYKMDGSFEIFVKRVFTRF